MQVKCPQCLLQVPVRNVSLDTGWAKCDACNEVFALSEVVSGYQIAAAPAPLERPFDAWANLERTPLQLGIVIRPQGMRAAAWGLLGFATFWIAFITFWTGGALGLFFGRNGAWPPRWENAAFACFSIPFWAAGFGMLGGVLWMARGSLSVYLDEAQMYTEWRCLVWRRGRFISREKVQCARPYVCLVNSSPDVSRGGSHFNQQNAVEVVYEKGSFKLPCNSLAEQAWLIGEINDFLKAVPYSAAAISALGPDYLA